MTKFASMLDRLTTMPKLLLLTTTALVAMSPQAMAAAAATATATAEAPAVGEVVVTAQRREERLQDVPAAVTAFAGPQLERLGITGSKQLTQVTPGLNFTQSVYSPQPTIRGVGVRGVAAGDELVVPIYVDGVYQPFIPAADLQFNDVERIEVLKGPQGALFGRNATGGAINIITKTPTSDPHANLSLRYGRFNDLTGKVYLSGGTDKIAGDVALVASRDDGYIHDNLRNDTYGGGKNVSARSKIVAHPNDMFDITLAGGVTNNSNSDGVAYNSFNGNTISARVPGNVVTTTPFQAHLTYHPYFKVLQHSVSLTGVGHFDGFDVTALSGYQWDVFKNKTDSDAGPIDLNDTYNIRQYSENEYNEVYVVSNGNSKLSWIAGGVFYHDISGNKPATFTTVRTPSPTGVIPAFSISGFQDRILTDSYAAYAQVTYKFTDQWSATVGGRYTSEHKTFRTDLGYPVLTSHLPGPPGSTIAGVAGAPDHVAATFSKFTPSAIIQYQPTTDLNFYVKAGQAFKSGIFNASAATPIATKPINPETLTQYEVGAKAAISPQVRLNVSAYYTDYKNLQSTARDPVTFTSVLQNAGAAKIYGFEAEAYVRPMENLNLRIGIAGLHGTYNNFPTAQVLYPNTSTDTTTNAAALAANGCQYGNGVLIGGNRAANCDVAGNKIIRTPSFTANLGGDYTIPIQKGEIILTGNVFYQGKFFWDVLNRVDEPGHTLVNGQIEWRSPDDKLGVALWGENLLNKTYRLTASISTAGDNQVIAKPRTYGVELTYNW